MSNHGTFHPSASERNAQGSSGSANPANGADPNTLINHFAGMSLHGANVHANPGNPYPHWVGPHGIIGFPQVMYDNYHMAAVQAQANLYENPNAPAPAPGSAGNVFGLHMPVNPMIPFTPSRSHFAHSRAERGQSDVPGLENRRGSYSTTESTPATPFWAGVSNREHGPRVASLDRSTYTTPSPQQLASLAMDAGKPVVAISDSALDELLKKEPPVPKAVPAVFTPVGQMKSLEQSLENRIPGNRNVYIRGLHPTTDDELLYHYAARFGAVETSKAIIDTSTGACKGFGFAKFYDARDSDACIRGFHRLGYEVGFARESFNSRLKAQGDEGSTNLYISNLPKSLNEMELGTIFLGYTILSSKILRDSMGNSRGVGFARFETRDVCDEVIRKFNGIGIGEEGLPMNIRYADTPAQKELKRVTAERRQFRTNEYNIGAYGTPLVGMNPNAYQNGGGWRRSNNISRSEGSSSREGETGRGHAGSQRGESQTATSVTTNSACYTPTSSECDEGVTIHADSTIAAVPTMSVQSSPSTKKEMVKKETIKKENE